MSALQGDLKVTYILESLDKIADKIGMTVEQLWPFLVKQVYNEAMLGAIAIFVFTSISLYILLRYGEMRFLKWSETEEIEGRNKNVIKDYQKVCTIFPLIVIGLLLTVFIFADIPRFLNPEYFAFEDLMKMLRRVN